MDTMLEETIIREITTAYLTIKLRDDGIVITEETPGFPNESSLAIAAEIMDAIRSVCGDQSYPMMVRMSNRMVNKDERRYYMKQDNMPVSKVAMIVKSPFQRLLANFLVGINKVPYDTRLFTDEDEAVRWLKQ